MNSNSTVTIARRQTGWGRLSVPLLLAALLALTIAAYGGIVAAGATTSGSAFNDVQVSIETVNALPSYQYTVSAFNSTGGLVASYQSGYAMAAFELPAGEYVFTAAVTGGGSQVLPPGITNGVTVTSSQSAQAGEPAIICCVSSAPQASGSDSCCISSFSPTEYGFVSDQVSGPTSLTISAKPLNETQITPLTIHVSYANGTAASGVSVSGSVIGDTYGWEYGSNAVSLSNTTDAQGTAILMAPSAPILVSATNSVPIVLPQNETTTQVTVAGVTVNVTATWEPQYVNFAGQALVVPPQSGASIVLQYQPEPVPTPVTMTTGTATPDGGSVGVASQQATAKDSLSAGVATTPSSSPGGLTLPLSLGAVALSAVALSVALFVTRSRGKPARQ